MFIDAISLSACMKVPPVSGIHFAAAWAISLAGVIG
jgi:hypothetical protein